MSDKASRQALLKELTETETLTSQGAILERLGERGMRVNQSTLSRDLSELDLQKVNGTYRKVEPMQVEPRLDLSPAVRRWVTCGPHLIVVHTSIGQAQAIGVVIDSSGESSITGTLAGDDTLFIATRSRQKQNVALRRLARWFGEKHERA